MDYDKLYSKALEHAAAVAGPWSTAQLASVATTLSSRQGRSNGLSAQGDCI